jgi:nucleotide-binding universal stress UspA family protein
MARTVVVGVEGTGSSHDALIWAAAAAAPRKDTLEIVYAIGVPYADMDLLYDDAVEQGAQSLLHDERERALKVQPDLTVTTTLTRETPGKALTEASEQAALVVVGSHPYGVLERVFSGSLSYQVAAGSHCPVLVVPQETGGGGSGVVVGADGSPDSVAAVALAATEADRLGQELTVVHAWRSPDMFLSGDTGRGYRDERVEEGEGVVLAESVAGLGERYPDLVVHQLLVQSQPAQALLDAAKGARLLVVGSRGLGGVARMLLGSVSHTLVLHPPCPVLVMRT